MIQHEEHEEGPLTCGEPAETPRDQPYIRSMKGRWLIQLASADLRRDEAYYFLQRQGLG